MYVHSSKLQVETATTTTTTTTTMIMITLSYNLILSNTNDYNNYTIYYLHMYICNSSIKIFFSVNSTMSTGKEMLPLPSLFGTNESAFCTEFSALTSLSARSIIYLLAVLLITQ